MKTFVVSASIHQTTSVFVNNNHFSVVSHNIIFVPLEKSFGAKSLFHMINRARMLWRVEIFHSKEFFNFVDSFFGQSHASAFFVQIVIFWRKLRSDFRKLNVAFWIFSSWRRNDQRSSRFVNQNRVNFVDNRKIQFALAKQINFVHHVVAQIIETEFVVCSISDVRRVSFFSGYWAKFAHFFVFVRFVVEFWVKNETRLVDNHTNRKSQEVIKRAHPASVTLRKVIIDGHHVNTFAFHRVQNARQSRHQSLTFTSFHFGSFSFVKNHTTN